MTPNDPVANYQYANVSLDNGVAYDKPLFS